MAGLGGVTGGLGGLEHRRSVEPSSVRPRRPSFSLSLSLRLKGAGAGGPLLPLFGRILMTDGNWEGRGCGWHLHSPLSIADCQVRRAAKLCQRLHLCQRLRVRVCEAASRRTLPCPSLNFAPISSSRPIATCSMDGTHFQLASMQTKFQMLPLKTASQACISTRSFRKEHFNGMLQLVMVEESCKRGHLQLITGPSLEQVRSEKLPADKIEEYISYDLDEGLQDKSDIATDSAEGRVNICDREMERRRKIGLANKGRTPWNKGRKHNQETRELIKKRTIEAMRDPKVRKKMSERPRSHSDLSKARIGASLRSIWVERLKHKRSQEKCYLIWARSIAEAAKEGGLDQWALSWDSYEKEKSDLKLQYLQWKSEKARAKEIAKLRAEIRAKVRAEIRAKVRAEKLVSLAQEKNEKEEKAKARKIEALERKKLKDEKRKMALYEGLKLKARLSKKQLDGLISIQRKRIIEPQPVIDRIKINNMRRSVSLADQIRAVKNKKAETAAPKVFETGQYDSSVEEKEG